VPARWPKRHSSPALLDRTALTWRSCFCPKAMKCTELFGGRARSITDYECRFALAESVCAGHRHLGCLYIGYRGSLLKRTQNLSLFGFYLPELQENVAHEVFSGRCQMLRCRWETGSPALGEIEGTLFRMPNLSISLAVSCWSQGSSTSSASARVGCKNPSSNF